MKNGILLGIFLGILGFLGTGCKSVQVKPTGRPASDQLLVARVMSDAIRQMDVHSELKGTSVTVTLSGQGIDAEQFSRVLEAWLVTVNGAVIAKNADLNLHVMVEAAGSDTNEMKWQLPIPLPTAQLGISLSSIVLARNTVQFSRCHIWTYATNKANKTVFVQPPVYSTHYVSNREFLGISLGSWSDLKEIRKRRGEKLDALPIKTDPEAGKLKPSDLISDGLL